MRKRTLAFILLMALMLPILAACGGSTATNTPASSSSGAATTAPATAAPAGATTAPAGATTAPSGSSGAGDTGKVSVLGAFSGAEADKFEEVVKVFEAANPGIDVVYTGVSDFDTQIVVKVQANDTPDIAAFPQPGGAARLAKDGQIVPLWPEAIAKVDANYAPFWKDLATFDGTPYGVFHRVNAKGWIWYNKPAFEKAGFTAPKTWEELTALTEQMKSSGIAPWCEGIESDAATGWKGTDWVENIMLRTQPTSKYDDWIAGKLKFSSPEVKNAFEILGKIWTDPAAVYGGQATIALTKFSDAATFLFGDKPNCWLHMQGSFVTGFFPEAVQKDLDNQVGVFIMPPIDPAVTPALEVGGDVFVTMKGKDRPEVKKFMEFLATADSATPWAKLGGGLFPHKGQDVNAYPTSIERTMVQTILDAKAARFDASDAMPAATNAAFWKGITDWVTGSRDLDGALADIDKATP